MAAAAIATFVSGIVIAFTKSWQLTLILLAVIPFIAVSSGAMNVLGGRFQTRIQEMYSKSGTIAEESISAARTVMAFNSQRKVTSLYNSSLAGARAEGLRKYFVTGIGIGSFNFFLYCSYSLCFYYSQFLLGSGILQAGDVVNVFFAVLIGAFSLGNLAPDLQAFAFGVGAGTKLFATIDRCPPIDSYSAEGVKLHKREIKGRIELKDVASSLV